MDNLSAQHRRDIALQLSQGSFDVLIIGGGITGAGIALDAASRGLKTALIEKGDFASGTSSRSTKLIHGGLRYLKQLEFKLVREVGSERAIIHRLAPHLVRAEKMLLPLVKNGAYGKWVTSLGLWTYDRLAGVSSEDQRIMLNKIETLEKEPLLRSDILLGSGFYAEYRTDDARLTLENIKTAILNGALCLNYIQAESFIYNKAGKISGVNCLDPETGNTWTIQSRFVVNAAGPWVDQLRARDNSLGGKRIFHSKGVHIVVPRDRFPIRQAAYFDAPDKRMIFAVPRQGITYIGTTDTPYENHLDHLSADEPEAAYLLSSANNMFPCIQLRLDDIQSSWAGLRPLIYEAGKSASEMSRKDEILESPSGLLTIAGGKLTGYRKMAERIVDRLAKRYQADTGRRLNPCQTSRLHLGKHPFQTTEELQSYQETISRRLIAFSNPTQKAEYLVSNYGRQTEEILELLPDCPDPEIALAKAEVRFTIENELALHALDFLNRRSGRLYFQRPSIEHILDAVLEAFRNSLNWSPVQVAEERAQVYAAMKQANF